MVNFIIVAVIFLIVGGAVAYIIKEKRKGAVCVGCPHAGECAKKRKGGCGGSTQNEHS